MELEYLISGGIEESYSCQIVESSCDKGLLIVDWKQTILGIVDDVRRSVDASLISARFHNSLVLIVLDVAKRVGIEKVVLSGGCFQNVYLTERCIDSLRREGYRPYWHQRVPPNDGGIALGQIYAFARMKSNRIQGNGTRKIIEKLEVKET